VAPPARTGTGEAAATTSTHISLKIEEKNFSRKSYYAAVYDSEKKLKIEEKRSQRSKIFSSKVSLLLKIKNSCFFPPS
jgi:hypothetical protein